MSLQNIKVLLVNENRDRYMRVVDLLRQVSGVGYELTWCSNREHALEGMLSGIHDVILMDCDSSVEGCLELLNSANAQDCFAPILCLTEKLNSELDRTAISSGAADYLIISKIDPGVLERTIRYAMDRKYAEKELARLAHYDLLTGIPNRLLFNDRLDRALRRAGRGEAPFALLYIDLDGFKKVNDTHGHGVGDQLVKGIAERLSECIRRTDSVARVGGDEFTVLLERVAATNDVVSVAQKIIDVICEPFSFGGQLVQVGCSIGIAAYPDAGQDAETLIRHADMAMYEAKALTGSNFRFFSEALNVAVVDQGRIEQELEVAIKEDQLQLYFQPRISLKTEKIIGLEALVRWNHPSKGLILPGEFIEVAEQTGLISTLGWWVLNRLCAYIREMDDADLPRFRVSQNLSLGQFGELGFVENIVAVAENHGVSLNRFEFELAEPEVLANLNTIGDEMDSLSSYGAKFALDDFGTGFSSLPQLQRLPISTLKLDPSHVQSVTSSEDSANMVRAMIYLSHGLDMKVVAEGVETDEQKEFLASNNCDHLQGYVYSAPLPFDDLLTLMKRKGATSRRSYLSVVDPKK